MGGSIYFAPAKINLCLHVTAKRTDGYHELCMIMYKIDLCDELVFTATSVAGVRLQCLSEAVGAAEDNLVTRAARAILQYDPQQRGLDIKLTKRIPVAAGLGGGSSDAATTLMAVNSLLELNLDRELLHREALALGADVPFFLYASAAWALGIGDQLCPVTIAPKFWLVLVNPAISISTAQVYNSLTAKAYTTCPGVKILATTADLLAILHNDLESVTMDLCPQVQEMKTVLIDMGADGVLMSGSGPTVFGVYFNQAKANVASRALQQERGWWSVVATGWQQ